MLFHVYIYTIYIIKHLHVIRIAYSSFEMKSKKEINDNNKTFFSLTQL